MEAMAAVRQMMVGINPAPSSTHEARKISLDADNLIVERCLAGEEAAWEDMVRIHTRRVYAICYRFTGSDHKAQDLTQEVFLRVFRSLKNFHAGEGSFSVWLGRVARNLLIDDYRKTKLERATIRSRSGCLLLKIPPLHRRAPMGCWPAARPAKCCRRHCNACRRSCGKL